MAAAPDDGLWVLRLTLDTGPEQLVRLRLCRTGPGDLSETWTGAVPAAEIGMPVYARGEELDDDLFRLPAETVLELRGLLGAHVAPVLLLQLVEPIGYLGLVPWERLLAPAFEGPIVRLPTISLSPRKPAGDLEVLLLAAAPNEHAPGMVAGLLHGAMRKLNMPPTASAPGSAAGHATPAGTRSEHPPASPAARRRSTPGDLLTAHDVESVVDAILAGSPRVTTVHVVTTPWIYHDLHQRWRSSPRKNVRLHNPRHLAERLGHTEPVADLPVSTTWLRLAEVALEGKQADVVHVLCHADLFGARVRLAFAEAPVPASVSRSRHASIEAVQTLLNVVGAWSFALSSPPGNPTTPQLRLAATRLAEVRPGPISFTDLSMDGAASDIASAYGFVYAPEPMQAPHLASGMLICEPHRLRASVAGMESFVTSPGDDGPAAGSVLLASLQEPESPAWIAAAQRLIEQYQADLTRLERDAPVGSASPMGREASAGVHHAIDTIYDLVARFIDERGDDRGRQ